MTAETEPDTAPGVVAKMTLPTLTAMVVGSMVGAGVFSLPARFEVATGILGSLIAWAVAGTGMLMLGFVFQNLAIRKPNLDSGVFIYAKAGFGDYAGQLRRRRHVPGRGSRHRRSVALPLPDREDLPLRRRPG